MFYFDQFVVLAFDDECRLRERAVYFGRFDEVARNLHQTAQRDSRKFPLGGAVIASPSFFPGELSAIVRDALALKLPPHMGRTIAPHLRIEWCGERSKHPPL